MNSRHLNLLIVALIVAATANVAFAQTTQPCQPQSLVAPSKAANIFTAEQENDLGDAIAEHVHRDFRLIEDQDITRRLGAIGASLVKQLPPTDLRFQFFLIDLPDANAFAMPGGRVYISRKLIAFTRNEDELASVLAHELGHLAARQTAVEMSQAFKKVLGVTQVGDRRDVFEKYNQLVENIGRRPNALAHGEDQKEQLEADRIGLFAMSAAGYDPQAFAAFWDRYAETKGKTGGFFSDLFGRTSPDARRLKEILRGLQTLPAECRTQRPTPPAADYEKWQADVVSYSGTGRKDILHDVAFTRTLEPPLRGDINHLQFSPDGKYLLAQDDSGINILTRDPFAPLFRIEAPEARDAQFSPDSKSIVFYSPTLRVESWNLIDKKPGFVREMYVRDACMQSDISPDAKTIACLDTNYTLILFDVATGASVFQKKDFFKPDLGDFFNMILLGILRSGDADLADLAPDIDWVSMKFSPDGRYFAAGQRSTNPTMIGTVRSDVSAVIVDLSTREPIQVKGQLKKLLSGRFAFLTPERIVAVNPEDGRKSAIMSFPSGETIETIEIGGKPDNVARGDYVLLRPLRNYAVGVFDLASKKVIIANRNSAFDLYQDVFASERVNGEIGIYKVADSNQMVAKVVLPRNTLGRLRAASVSADFKWLAVSERSRGAVWDLNRGERVFHVRGFRGAHFANDGILYADFPTQGNTRRTVARLNLATGNAVEGPALEDSSRAEQHGPYVVLRKPIKDGGDLRENISIEVQDVKSGQSMWTKEFPKEAPRIWVDTLGDTMILSWGVKTNAAKAAIKADAKLTQILAGMKEKEGDYLVQVLDAKTGKQTGSLLIETGKGSFRVADVAAAGGLLVISDTENRVLVYSLAEGAQKGRFFGGRPSVSENAGLLAVENEAGKLSIYELATMEKRDQFSFSDPVALTRFSADGKRLFVLTRNQQTYVLNMVKTKAEAGP